jgi:hypothetical protein
MVDVVSLGGPARALVHGARSRGIEILFDWKNMTAIEDTADAIELHFRGGFALARDRAFESAADRRRFLEMAREFAAMSRCRRDLRGHVVDETLRCFFCDKSRDDVRKLIVGSNVNICDECVEVCVDVLADESRFTSSDGQRVAPHSIDPLSEFGLVFTCSLCRMPTTSDDAVLIPERGALCPGCLGEVEAAAAKKRGT